MLENMLHAGFTGDLTDQEPTARGPALVMQGQQPRSVWGKELLHQSLPASKHTLRDGEVAIDSKQG